MKQPRQPRGFRWIAVGQVLLWTAIGGGAFLLLAKSVQNSSEFGRLQLWILGIDVCGVIALTGLLTHKLWRLVRDYRAHVPGSRLTARTVGIFGALVIAPLLIVYMSSLEFINRGIDSWFTVEVKQGLNDALDLSRAALDLRMREYSTRTVAFADELADGDAGRVQEMLDAQRRDSHALEISVFGPHGRILGASLENAFENLPAQPPPDLLRQMEQRLPYVSLEPLSTGRYLIRTAAVLPRSSVHGARFVVAIYAVPAQLAALSEAVQATYNQYGNLAAIREPLKASFRVTLTLVVLLAMLAAIYGAIYSAQRLVRPVQDLIEGTRAVGKGDFATRLPLPSRDEMGFLVHSFNDMTKRLRRARAETTHSQQAVERERTRLAIILARLSTGVLAIDRTLTVRTANEAAGAILGTDLSAAAGRALPELAGGNERLGQFVAALAVRFAAGREEWREQLDLDGAGGRRTLMCACTALPGEDSDVGFVIVFDDITALLQAQRDAAWGEVARRLAHEIKNPLHPDPAVRRAHAAQAMSWVCMSPRTPRSSTARRAPSCSRWKPCSRWSTPSASTRARPEMQIIRFDINHAGHRGRGPVPRRRIRACHASGWTLRTAVAGVEADPRPRPPAPQQPPDQRARGARRALETPRRA